jgi:hypothetical protein
VNRTEIEVELLKQIGQTLNSIPTLDTALRVEALANAYAVLNETSQRARFMKRPPRPGSAMEGAFS